MSNTAFLEGQEYFQATRNPELTPEELTALQREVSPMTTSDLLAELSDTTLQAIQNDLAARPQPTPEELAYFAAEKELSDAIQKATQAAQTALDTQTAADLSTTSTCFAVAADAAKALSFAKSAMDAAFLLTDEYAAPIADLAKKGGAQ